MVKKILVVEDRAVFLEPIRSYFTHQGFKVFTAKNLRAARALLESEKFDRAVTDVFLPRRFWFSPDGIEVARICKKKGISVLVHSTIENNRLQRLLHWRARARAEKAGIKILPKWETMKKFRGIAFKTCRQIARQMRVLYIIIFACWFGWFRWL